MDVVMILKLLLGESKMLLRIPTWMQAKTQPPLAAASCPSTGGKSLQERGCGPHTYPPSPICH